MADVPLLYLLVAKGNQTIDSTEEFVQSLGLKVKLWQPMWKTHYLLRSVPSAEQVKAIQDAGYEIEIGTSIYNLGKMVKANG